MYVNYQCGCSTIDVHVRHTLIKNLIVCLWTSIAGIENFYNVLVLVKQKIEI